MKEMAFLAIGFTFGALWMKGRRDDKDLKKELETLRAKTATA